MNICHLYPLSLQVAKFYENPPTQSWVLVASTLTRCVVFPLFFFFTFTGQFMYSDLCVDDKGSEHLPPTS
jgi:hypothetical protein